MEPNSKSQTEILRKALKEIRELKAEVVARRRAEAEPIAIIGMACRLPGGADTPERFWELLRMRRDATSEVPEDRWPREAYYDPDPEASGKMYVQRGGFLTEVDRFDPQHFGVSPREAVSMDPQQRLLLEVAWEAFEQGGQAPDTLRDSATGVFIGIIGNEYFNLMVGGEPGRVDAYATVGNISSVASGRISYTFGLRGPSISVDTACSSSLVAVHLACQSLRSGESALALAGGVNLMLAPITNVALCRMRALSRDGRSRAFEADAEGYGRGEGCALVLLKRLDDALRDEDRIIALIRGSAVNQDGPSSGLTVPSGPAQQEVIRQALRQANLTPSQIEYVETHGTGTSLGDPIEVSALVAALGGVARSRPLTLGSVKANLGHLEGAAGIASLMKVALALDHEEIPGQPFLESVNPRLPLEKLPAEIARELLAWPRSETPRRAGVSSFGFSGTNVHAVLEEAPSRPRKQSEEQRPSHVLCLSARTESGLVALADRYRRALKEGTDDEFADFCFSANTGRARLAHRLAVVAASRDEACQALAAFQSGDRSSVVTGVVTKNNRPRVAFLFTGQGAQYPQMARTLYATEPTFREALDRCDELLREHLGCRLVDLLAAPAESPESTLLNQTGYAQPALFAIEYALVELWRSWGVVPFAVLGHSLGELVAACVAGVFELADGLRLVAARARLMQGLPGDGGMLSVNAPAAEVEPLLASSAAHLSLAAINAPDELVVSGRLDVLAELEARLGEINVRTKRLTVSHAFHSPLMDPILDPFYEEAARIRFSPPRIPLVSNVSGTVAKPEQLDAAYFRRHVRAPVRFGESVLRLAELGCDHFVEIGPGSTLTALARRSVEQGTWVASLRRDRPDWDQLLRAAAQLFVGGVEVDWKALERDRGRRRVPVPTYPFERQRFWFSGPTIGQPSAAVAPRTQRAVEDCLYELAWEPGCRLDADPRPIEGTAWLLFVDEHGWGTALAKRLRERGATVFVIERGTTYEHVEPRHFAIDASDPEHYARLWRELRATETRLEATVYLWALDVPSFEAERAESESMSLASQTLAIDGALLLTQAALESPGQSGPIWLVTKGSQPALRGSPLSVEQSPLWGFGRCLAMEHPELWGGMVDLDPAASADVADEVARLLEEVRDRRPNREDQVAVRGGERFVARLRRQPATDVPSARPIGASGTYLITGGAGGLGLEVAWWLISRGAKRLVLTGRRTLPPRSKWNDMDMEPRARRVVDALIGMERAGADVRYLAIDAASARATRALMEELAGGPAPLKGIFHAAGVTRPSAIRELDRATFADVMGSKAFGAWHLHRMTRELSLELEHFVLFSSISAVWGSVQLSPYAAANHFLDALAHHRQAEGLQASSIGWGPWAETGMSSSAEEQAYLGRMGIEGLSTQLALAALSRVCDGGAAQTVVASMDWPRFSAIFSARSPRRLLEEVSGEPAHSAVGVEPPPSTLLVRLRSVPAGERAASVERYLLERLGQAMMMDPTGLDPSLAVLDLGADSLAIMDVIAACQRDLELRLYPREFFERPSLRELARYVTSELGLDDESQSRKEAPSRKAPGASGQRSWVQPSRKNPSVAFLLSSARSGSTLLRVMLAGHSQLFCPPELHLLPYFSMKDRHEDLAASHLDEGLTRAIMEQCGGDLAAAEAIVKAWEDDDALVQDVYAHLQNSAGSRLLVDKSPSYAGSLETLEWAEKMFDSPKYVLLWRHPYAVIESFVRNRLDRVLGVGGDPMAFAEEAWATANANLLDFARRSSPERVHQVFYEDLVRDPRSAMTALCAFLGVPFEQAVLEPYAGERMTDGIRKESLSIGDPNLKQHSAIDVRLGETWRRIRLPRRLGGFATRIAQELGYELRNQNRSAPADVATPLDLACEVELDAELRPAGRPGGNSKPGAVLLTGATGFVGSYLLASMLARTCKPVLCLVRCASVEEGRERVRASLKARALWKPELEERIRVVRGDLSAPRLGLDPAGFEELGRDVDTIYHNGAHVHFAYPYEALKAPNVGGTREILKLARLARDARIHYVSTYGVWGIGDIANGAIVREDDDLHHDRYLVNGYLQTKWVAETILRDARRRGFFVNVFRLGRVTGHSRTGECDPASFTVRLIKGCIELGRAPDLAVTMDMTPIDFGADAMVAIAEAPRELGADFHIMNPNPVSFPKLVQKIRALGHPLEVVPTDLWLRQLGRAQERGEDNALHPILKHVEYILRFGGRHSPTYDTSRTVSALRDTDVACPEVDDAMLDFYFRYLSDTGVLPKPR